MSRRNEAKARAHWLRPKSEGGLGGITLSHKFAKMLGAGIIDADDARERGLRPHINKGKNP